MYPNIFYKSYYDSYYLFAIICKAEDCDCEDFEADQGAESQRCAYCEHPPARHQKKEETTADTSKI